MKLNNIKEQIAKLEGVTDKGFATLIYQYTRAITAKGLDNLLDETLESEDQGEPVTCIFDENYFSVASEYYDIHIKEHFGRFGYACLYMDELGRGLVVYNY